MYVTANALISVFSYENLIWVAGYDSGLIGI